MDLFDLMQQQTADFERQMTKVIDRLNRKIQKILDGLEVVNGNYVVSGQNLDEALLLSTQLEQALIDSGYPQLAERTIRDNRKLLDLRKEELKTLLGRQRLGGIDPDMFKALQSMDFKGMTGLGGTTLNQIQESLFNSVNLGLSQSTLRNELIKRTNVLKRHAETYIRTSKREYAQHVENGIADQIGFGKEKDDIWEYSPGILQKNSHEECIWAVNKRYFTNEEKMAFEEGGGYAHSEPRFNCVHRFVITAVTYEEAFGGGGDDSMFTKDGRIRTPQTDMEERLSEYVYGNKVNVGSTDIEVLNGIEKAIISANKDGLKFSSIETMNDNAVFAVSGHSFKIMNNATFSKFRKALEIQFREKQFYNASAKLVNTPKDVSKFIQYMAEHEVGHLQKIMVKDASLGGYGERFISASKSWIRKWNRYINKIHREDVWHPSEYVKKFVKSVHYTEEWFAESYLLYKHNPALIKDNVILELLKEFDKISKDIIRNTS